MREYFPISEKIGTKSPPQYSYILYSYKKECVLDFAIRENKSTRKFMSTKINPHEN